jgi:hypothetical protein
MFNPMWRFVPTHFICHCQPSAFPSQFALIVSMILAWDSPRPDARFRQLDTPTDSHKVLH